MAARNRRATSQAALEVARKARANNQDGPVRLSTGYWVVVRPVSYSLITEAQQGIEDPPVPTFFDDDKGREEENPHDPAYVAALEKANADRVVAGLDVMLMMGIELVDETGAPIPIPDPASWLGKLRFLHKRGLINLDSYDFDDPADVEFAFKRFLLVSAGDIDVIGSATGLTEEAIEQAEASFQADKE